MDAQRRVALCSELWLSPLHQAEWEHAIAQHVFRRLMSEADAQQTRDRFVGDCEVGLWMVIDLPDGIFDKSIALARRHVAAIGARTLDTLHVASALELKAQRFWTFDERQAKLARAAGLKLS